MPRLHKRAQPLEYVDEPTHEDYAQAARWGLGRRDYRLAVEQIAAALSDKPHDPNYLGLLAEILDRARGPLQLVTPNSGEMFFGLLAVRARVLARCGRPDDATRELFQATAFQPSVDYLRWARPWVEPRRGRAVQPATIALGVTELLQACDQDKWRHHAGVEATLEAAVELAAIVSRRHPAHIDLQVSRSRLLRRLGRYNQAQQALEGIEPCWAQEVERAALMAAQGRQDEAIVQLRAACQRRPDEPSSWLELGDALLDEADLAGSAKAYEQALRCGPSLWADISRGYLDALRSGEPPAAVTVALEDERVMQRARTLEADASAYVTRLADPIDPLVGVIRSVWMRGKPSAERVRVRVRSERPACPAAKAAFGFALQAHGCDGELLVEAEGSLELGALWESPPPVPEQPALDAIAAIAAEPFGWQAWCEAARTHQARGLPLSQLVAAMAHTQRLPQPSAEIDPVRWVHGCQLAAALLIAAAPTAAEERQQALASLLDGYDDWSAAAAALGLRALAEQEQGRSADIALQLLQQLDRWPAASPCTRALAIAGAAIADNPRPFLRLRARVRKQLATEPSRVP